MANQSGIDQILSRWRDEIKKKQRRIISFDETVDIKIKALKRWISTQTEPVSGWEYREFRYSRHRERVYAEQSWRPIAVGQTWGGPDVSAEFRCSARIPEGVQRQESRPQNLLWRGRAAFCKWPPVSRAGSVS